MSWHPGEKSKDKVTVPYKAPVNNNEYSGAKPYTKVPPPKRLTPVEMEVRKKQNFCFNCDEIYHVRHRCNKSFVILVEDEQINDEAILSDEDLTVNTGEMEVTLNALAGNQIPDTIK